MFSLSILSVLSFLFKPKYLCTEFCNRSSDVGYFTIRICMKVRM